MIRYIFVFLTINIYSCSLEASAVNYSLPNLLNYLSSKCGDSFLSLQIQERIKDCNVTIPPYEEIQLQCLMFFDINQHMCSILGPKTNFDFNSTDKNYLKADQSVYNLCNGTKDWKFNNIAFYPNYIVEIENIRSNKVTCYRLCSENKWNSSNSNFFCKYYKWGLDILRSLGTSATDVIGVSNMTHNTGHDVKPTNLSSLTSVVTETSSIKGEHLQESRDSTVTLKQNISKANDNLNANHTQDSLSVPQLNSPVSNIDSKSALSSSQVNQNSSMLNLGKGPSVVRVIEDSNGTHIQETSTSLDSKTTQLHLNNSQLQLADSSKLSTALNPGTDKKAIEIQQQPHEELSLPGLGLPAVKKLSHKYQNEELDDYLQEQDMVEHKIDEPPISHDDDSLGPDDDDEDSQPDLQGIKPNIDIPHADISQKDLTVEEGVPKQQVKFTETKIEPPLSSLPNDNSQKEFSAQDQEGFAEEDDNFFPFFLTAVILVILLYVFYHNKNRILGLIVEGRRSNRRRNSRGHAYRRLDTLEQAMSGGKGTTPPSKIIY